MAEKKGKLFIISAPSGAGKTTLVKETIERLKNKYNISKVITYTTREPRTGEINGIDYHFVSHEEFEKKMNNGFFLENTTYINKTYASPASIRENLNNQSLILVVDRDGAKSTAQAFSNVITIWIMPPNIENLKSRIITRGTETVKQIEKRLKLAEEEMLLEKKHRSFKYHVVNDNFDQTVSELISIIESELS